MRLLISFVITEYETMKLHWARHSVLASNDKIGTNQPIGKDVDLGGCLVELDWNSKKEISRLPLSCPSGFDFLPGGILVASMRRNLIYYIDKQLQIIRTISHPLFNDLHSVTISSNGFLVTSTGIDAILELNLEGQVVWSWLGFQNGYEHDQFGNVRHLDPNVDHRLNDYPTLTQTTHVNSAAEDPNDHLILYASLFHQGKIIRIHRENKTHSTVFAGLKNCHSIRATRAGFIVSNTRGAEIAVFDKDFHPQRSISIHSNWIADAFLSQRGTYFVADADNCQILELEDGKSRGIISRYSYDPNWKIFQIAEI